MTSTTTAARWVGAGWSELTDPLAAGEQAAYSALAGQDPALVVVFAPGGHDPVRLATGVRRAINGDVPLIGCSTAGQLTGAGSRRRAVSLLALGGEFGARVVGLPFGGDAELVGEQLGHDLGVDGGPPLAAAAAPWTVAEPPAENSCVDQVLLVLTDAAGPGSRGPGSPGPGNPGPGNPGAGRPGADPSALAAGLRRVTRSAVPMVGCTSTPASATGAGSSSQGWQLAGDGQDDRAFRGGSVAALLTSPAPIGVGLHHGWHRTGRPMMIDSVDGTVVHTVDGEPAARRYLDMIDRLNSTDPAAGSPRPNDRDPRQGQPWQGQPWQGQPWQGQPWPSQPWPSQPWHRHPLAVTGRRFDALRQVSTVDLTRGTLTLAAPVPAGSLAWIATAGTESILGAAQAACTSAVAQLEGRPPQAVLVFDGVGRRELLGRRATQQHHRLDRLVAPAALAGCWAQDVLVHCVAGDGPHQYAVAAMAVG